VSPALTKVGDAFKLYVIPLDPTGVKVAAVNDEVALPPTLIVGFVELLGGLPVKYVFTALRLVTVLTLDSIEGKQYHSIQNLLE
jgi:hypothetical protein